MSHDRPQCVVLLQFIFMVYVFATANHGQSLAEVKPVNINLTRVEASFFFGSYVVQ